MATANQTDEEYFRNQVNRAVRNAEKARRWLTAVEQLLIILQILLLASTVLLLTFAIAKDDKSFLGGWTYVCGFSAFISAIALAASLWERFFAMCETKIRAGECEAAIKTLQADAVRATNSGGIGNDLFDRLATIRTHYISFIDDPPVVRRWFTVIFTLLLLGALISGLVWLAVRNPNANSGGTGSTERSLSERATAIKPIIAEQPIEEPAKHAASDVPKREEGAGGQSNDAEPQLLTRVSPLQEILSIASLKLLSFKTSQGETSVDRCFAVECVDGPAKGKLHLLTNGPDTLFHSGLVTTLVIIPGHYSPALTKEENERLIQDVIEQRKKSTWTGGTTIWSARTQHPTEMQAAGIHLYKLVSSNERKYQLRYAGSLPYKQVEDLQNQQANNKADSIDLNSIEVLTPKGSAFKIPVNFIKCRGGPGDGGFLPVLGAPDELSSLFKNEVSVFFIKGRPQVDTRELGGKSDYWTAPLSDELRLLDRQMCGQSKYIGICLREGQAKSHSSNTLVPF